MGFAQPGKYSNLGGLFLLSCTQMHFPEVGLNSRILSTVYQDFSSVRQNLPWFVWKHARREDLCWLALVCFPVLVFPPSTHDHRGSQASSDSQALTSPFYSTVLGILKSIFLRGGGQTLVRGRSFVSVSRG